MAISPRYTHYYNKSAVEELTYDELRSYHHLLVTRWERLGVMERADLIVAMRSLRINGQRISLRQIAKWARCSEGTIRYYEIVGEAPTRAQEAIRKYQLTARQVVDGVRWWRKHPNGEAEDEAANDGHEVDAVEAVADQ